MTDTPIVIHQIREDGSERYLFTPDIAVFCVDERVPADRVYALSEHSTREEILSVLGTDQIGHKQDGSAASIRAHRAVAEIEGRPHLTVAEGEGE